MFRKTEKGVGIWGNIRSIPLGELSAGGDVRGNNVFRENVWHSFLNRSAEHQEEEEQQQQDE